MDKGMKDRTDRRRSGPPFPVSAKVDSLRRFHNTVAQNVGGDQREAGQAAAAVSIVNNARPYHRRRRPPPPPTAPGAAPPSPPVRPPASLPTDCTRTPCRDNRPGNNELALDGVQEVHRLGSAAGPTSPQRQYYVGRQDPL